jgi:hypothetical protein
MSSSSIPWIPWIPRIARVPRITDVPQVAEVLIHDHLVVKLADVITAQPVYVAVIQLTNSLPTHSMDIPALDETNCLTTAVVDVARHLSQGLLYPLMCSPLREHGRRDG